MKISVWKGILLLGLLAVARAQKKGKVNDDDDADVIDTREKTTRRDPGGGGRCSCRGLENQVDQLELRLDRMVDLWNDFVDKNRDPYEQQPGPYPPGSRRPPQGGRLPYMPQPQPPRYGANQGRNMMDEGQNSNNGARRFRF